MAKRYADKELTHDNWAEEEEPEEMGTFRQASSEQLASRQIKKAKRRNAGGDSSPTGMGLFKGLSGFSAFGGEKSSASKPSFSFLSSTAGKPTFSFTMSTATGPNTSSSAEKDGDKPTSQPFKLTQDSSSAATKALEPLKTNGFGPSTTPTQPAKSTTSTRGSKVFLAHLTALNEGVLCWVKQHLDKNPHVNLSPVFDDYKKHFEELNKKYPLVDDTEGDLEAAGKDKKDAVCEKENKPLTTESQEKAPGTSSSAVTTTADKTAETSTSKPLFTFGLAARSQGTEKTDGSSKPSFTFTGFDSTKKDSGGLIFGGLMSGASTKGFTFGASATSTSQTTLGTSGFSFSSATTAATTTTSASSPADSGGAKSAEDPADEPPSVQVNEVKEEDALYEKKCKLYYQKDKEYVDRGVGTLFLKPAGEKTQLIIRAYTNLGNILLNIVLNASIPTVRAGKNGVIIACVPNPPLEAGSSSTEPVKMLIKVKTAEDADHLLEKINEYKK